MPKATKSNDYDSLMQHLETRDDVQAAIDQVRTEPNEASSHKFNCQQQTEALNMQLQQKRDAAEQRATSIGESSTVRTAEVDELSEQLRSKQAEVQQAEQTIQSINEKIRELQAHPRFLEGIDTAARATLPT